MVIIFKVFYFSLCAISLCSSLGSPKKIMARRFDFTKTVLDILYMYDLLWIILNGRSLRSIRKDEMRVGMLLFSFV